MNALSKLLDLSVSEKEALGLVHTLPEVLQQPETWRRTYHKVLSGSGPIAEFLGQTGLDPGHPLALNVLLVGAGSSDYIGKSVSALLQKEWRCNVQAIPSTDLLTNMQEYVIPGHNYLWISFSRSGDSSEGVAVLEAALAEHPEIKHFIVTCNGQGRMARSFANHNLFSFVLDDEVNDRGLAMTSSFSNMVVVAQALAHCKSLSGYGPILEHLAAAASQILPEAAEVCESLVHDGFSKVCFLGSGSLKGAAIESGLKVLELTDGRVMSLAESFLGLRHGPLSAIDSDTLVVGFLSADERRRAFELDLIQEIWEKGLTRKFLSVYPRANSTTTKTLQNTLSLGVSNSVTDLYLPPVAILVGQLLGLFASLREGLKPDTPSPQGAINRVVSHVTIH
jgi:tagatose-6-phosphate ketose/aldose isomerase